MLTNRQDPNHKGCNGHIVDTTGMTGLYVKIHDNIFRNMYNLDMHFSSTKSQPVISDCISVLQVSEFLQAVPCVRRTIESHILSQGAYTYERITEQTEPWIDVAMRIQSPVIFREGMIHLIGRWNTGTVDMARLRSLDTGPAIIRCAEKKIAEITTKKRIIERQLVEFFPSLMRHPPPHPIRSVYANDIWLWIALTLVRQYIAAAYASSQHHLARDGGMALYSKLAAGGEAYIDAATLAHFDQSFSLSSKSKNCLGDALTHIKHEISTLVTPLLVNRSLLPNPLDAQGEYPYMTNAWFEDRELPWYRGPVMKQIRAREEDEGEEEERGGGGRKKAKVADTSFGILFGDENKGRRGGEGNAEGEE
jgi:hypothetical protein